MNRCSKCLTEAPFLVKYTDLTESWSLCPICNNAFDRDIDLLKEFMKEDFGGFPISYITRCMINARIARARGQSPWNKAIPPQSSGEVS